MCACINKAATELCELLEVSETPKLYMLGRLWAAHLLYMREVQNTKAVHSNWLYVYSPDPAGVKIF